MEVRELIRKMESDAGTRLTATRRLYNTMLGSHGGVSGVDFIKQLESGAGEKMLDLRRTYNALRGGALTGGPRDEPNTEELVGDSSSGAEGSVVPFPRGIVHIVGSGAAYYDRDSKMQTHLYELLLEEFREDSKGAIEIKDMADAPKVLGRTVPVWCWSDWYQFLSNIFGSKYGIYCVCFNIADLVDANKRESAVHEMQSWIDVAKNYDAKVALVGIGGCPEATAVAVNATLTKEFPILLANGLNFLRDEEQCFWTIDSDKKVVARLRDKLIGAATPTEWPEAKEYDAVFKVIRDLRADEQERILFEDFRPMMNRAIGTEVDAEKCTEMLMEMNAFGWIVFWGNQVLLEPEMIVFCVNRLIRNIQVDRLRIDSRLMQLNDGKDWNNYVTKPNIVSRGFLQTLWVGTRDHHVFLIDYLKSVGLIVEQGHDEEGKQPVYGIPEMSNRSSEWKYLSTERRVRKKRNDTHIPPGDDVGNFVLEEDD